MKVDYGIYLGHNSASIARMEAGSPIVLKSDTLKDSIPMCVYFNKKGGVQVGDSAYNALKMEQVRSIKTSSGSRNNAFVEFTRTLGTDKKYYSSHADKEFRSEELLAEVIKKLCSFDSSMKINAAFLTIPAAFKINQIAAVKRAGRLAGLKQVEIIQEPVAAAITYGLNSKSKNGFWLVFDFGGGTFDSALLKVEDGIQKVVDSEGDNHLGGKNLDFAIVDNLIIPHIEDNYSIEYILGDSSKRVEYRNSLKFFAEEIKNNLSFNKEYSIYVDPGDCGEDDDGAEIEIDLVVSQDQLEKVLRPIFQKAINCSLELLERNNLKGFALDTLVLVGEETYSPILRKMLREQICEPDSSIDPTTAIAKGAALYASTIDLNQEIVERSKMDSKIQLEVSCESTSVETEEFVTIKILEDETQVVIPEIIYAEIIRGDNAWTSGKIEINTIGEVLEVQLKEEDTNIFGITLFDDKGNLLDCEPSSFTIIQGIRVTDSMNTLPYNIGIEIKDKNFGKDIFSTIRGLEKNKSLPVLGVLSGLKTQYPIRPGVESDIFKIGLYQGEHDADGARAILSHYTCSVRITGKDIPTLLPKGSEVDLTISINSSQEMVVQVYFPYLNYSTEAEVSLMTNQKLETSWLANEIKKAKLELSYLKKYHSDSKLSELELELFDIEDKFNKNLNDVDNKQEVLRLLRKVIKEIDNHFNSSDKNILTSIEMVEDLLFQLAEDGYLSSSEFQKYFEQIYEMKSKENISIDTLLSIHDTLKQYEQKK
ncbi:Hsp70 family protein [Aureispira sp. CCB-E]|uniref:Hsp70 family protein n=1 Tax=Aureispira sp. CCB-E TaxID=3051121 RepID=UPI002868DA45|nr:Hsp70 family protein [Aureispira sp. CCB-E]WMX16515.1 Hsp70 family protein [Aureispira sp. CCB-E]